MDEILARAGIFQGVEPSAVSALTKQLQPVDFPRGHTVFAEGEPGDRLYDIISGKIKIGRRSQDGRENLLTIMGPSDIFGELSVFDPGPRTSSWEERPLAVIQLRPGAEVSDDELCEHLMSRMASWQVPERWVRVDGIPRTGVGQARQATAAKPLCGGGAAARVDLLRGPGRSAMGPSGSAGPVRFVRLEIAAVDPAEGILLRIGESWVGLDRCFDAARLRASARRRRPVGAAAENVLDGDLERFPDLDEDTHGRVVQAAFDLAQVGVGNMGGLGQLTQGHVGKLSPRPDEGSHGGSLVLPGRGDVLGHWSFVSSFERAFREPLE